MPDCAIVALDIGPLLRLARLDVPQGNALFFGPFHQLPLTPSHLSIGHWRIHGQAHSNLRTPTLDTPPNLADDCAKPLAGMM